MKNYRDVFSKSLFIITVTLILNSCNNAASTTASLPTAGTNTLSKIEIIQDKTTIAKGLSTTLTAFATYADSSRIEVTSKVKWDSADKTIATVATTSDSVKATGVSVGTAAITATLDGKSASASLTVGVAELVSIDITPKSLSLPSSLNQQFAATGTYSDNTTQDLTSTAT